ncbi:triacylglycerol lipase [Conexibacter sp. SYSU D00693]|uniref:esterase/lipase family protein n=1 Tax=Conexibacter sp. SYSU D00693 TaxID=2812560 RepID=UPI00196A333F|nr:alpha/beta fold hydrolase [Conexibacter sp. SYSU D00693]
MRRRSLALAAAALAGLAACAPRAHAADALVCDAGVASRPATPLLLVHGTNVDSRTNWSWGFAKALRERGHGICTVDLPQRGTVDVQDSMPVVNAALREVIARAGGRKVSLIGHSQGGFHVVAALRLAPELAPQVDDVVGLAGLYDEGSTGLGHRCDDGCQTSLVQFGKGSRFMAAMRRFAFPDGPDVTAIGTLPDSTVAPQPAVNELPPGAGRSMQIQDVCPGRAFVDGLDHIFLAADAVSFALTADALGHPGPADPARIPRSTCSQLVFPQADLLGLVGIAPDALGATATTGSGTREEPPLRCPVAPECAAGPAHPAAKATARITSRRWRPGGGVAVRVALPAAGRVRLAFRDGAVTPSVAARAGRRTVRVPLRRCAQAGRRCAAVRAAHRLTVTVQVRVGREAFRAAGRPAVLRRG